MCQGEIFSVCKLDKLKVSFHLREVVYQGTETRLPAGRVIFLQEFSIASRITPDFELSILYPRTILWKLLSQ